MEVNQVKRFKKLHIDIPLQNLQQSLPKLTLNECSKVKCSDLSPSHTTIDKSYKKIGQGAYGYYIYNPSDDIDRGTKFSPKLAKEKSFEELKGYWYNLRKIIDKIIPENEDIKNVFIIPEEPEICKNENGCVIKYKTRYIKEENLIKYSDLTEDSQRKINTQLAKALKILQKNNIYHNDLHPMNILIEKIKDETDNEYKYEPRIIDWDLISSSNTPSDSQINECNMYYDDNQIGIDTCITKLLERTNTMGGGKKNKYLKIGNRYVYVGPRGGLYIRVKGEMKLLKKLKVKK
jgi:serine/threonine protein kinase